MLTLGSRSPSTPAARDHPCVSRKRTRCRQRAFGEEFPFRAPPLPPSPRAPRAVLDVRLILFSYVQADVKFTVPTSTCVSAESSEALRTVRLSCSRHLLRSRGSSSCQRETSHGAATPRLPRPPPALARRLSVSLSWTPPGTSHEWAHTPSLARSTPQSVFGVRPWHGGCEDFFSFLKAE